MVRTVLYVLLPLSIVVGLVLVFQGSIQTFGNYTGAHGLTSGGAQTIAWGRSPPRRRSSCSGTNGGGFFNVNSAHPFENPTGFTNFVEMLAVLVIPAALVFTYGRMAGSRRQGYAIYSTMMVMFLGAAIVAYIAEAHGSPAQHAAGLHTAAIHGSSGGTSRARSNASGPPDRRCSTSSRTVTSCGAVNSAWSRSPESAAPSRSRTSRRREVIFGGVGTGLYSILLYVLLAVFIGGLMVGRTPEYLGKKIEAREIKLVVLGLLITPLAALLSTALATASQAGAPPCRPSPPAPQFSETFYSYLSQANNNGSAFPGYTGYIQPSAGNLGAHGVVFADLSEAHDAVRPLRPDPLRPRVAGSLAGKRVSPPGLGTMRTDNPTFVVLLIGIIVLVGALTFFPALLLGPIVQGLTGHLD